jgi:hypothetical protein
VTQALAEEPDCVPRAHQLVSGIRSYECNGNKPRNLDVLRPNPPFIARKVVTVLFLHRDTETRDVDEVHGTYVFGGHRHRVLS